MDSDWRALRGASSIVCRVAATGSIAVRAPKESWSMVRRWAVVRGVRQEMFGLTVETIEAGSVYWQLSGRRITGDYCCRMIELETDRSGDFPSGRYLGPHLVEVWTFVGGVVRMLRDSFEPMVTAGSNRDHVR